MTDYQRFQSNVAHVLPTLTSLQLLVILWHIRDVVRARRLPSHADLQGAADALHRDLQAQARAEHLLT